MQQLRIFLQEDRKNKDMNQEDYAKLLGLNRSTLAHLEQGRVPGRKTAQKISEYFAKPVSELLGEDKLKRMENLETTNMLINSLIDKGKIKDKNIDDELKDLIWQSVYLEILLKLKLKK